MKKITINELKPGMYVEEIVKQKGTLKIKSQGKVTSRAVVSQLKKKGILELIINPAKAFESESAADAEETELSAGQQAAPSPAQVHRSASTSFEDELSTAKSLHEQGKRLQKYLLNAADKGLPVDISIPRDFTEKLIGSIDRNPNALMVMTRIREKDAYLLEHSLNVAILLSNFARHQNLADKDVLELAFSGFLHDIGKINVPDAILHKPGRLTDEEMVTMRKHVEYGEATLTEMGIPQRIINTMAEHHERLDGNGYPRGKKGSEISLFGRMIAIVDTYDAITAHRCYKPGAPSQSALKILLKEAQNNFDLELVQHFIKCIGIYPAGTLVLLDNEQLAVVIRHQEASPLKPEVKVFYSVRSKSYIPPKQINLQSSQHKIVKSVLADEYKIDFNRYFEEKFSC